jgi:hypothetical protein
MNLGLKTGLLGGAALLALAISVPAYAQDDISGLRQQLDAMKERLAKLEADKAEKRRVSSAAAVEAGDKPRSWKLPGTNTSMNIGGFVKFSAQYNFTGHQTGNGQQSNEGAGIGAYNFLGGANNQQDRRFNGGTWDLTARRSRFWIQTWTPTDWGELRTYIETDFVARVGASSNPAQAGAGGTAVGAAGEMLRLRHAYGTLGPVLIGKTTTLFGGLIGLPELLDDGAPVAPGALRIPQVRYTHNFGGGLTLSVAAEENNNISDAGGIGNAAVTCTAGVCAGQGANAFLGLTAGGVLTGPQRWPDITAALQWNFPNGAIYASGFVGQLNVDNGSGPAGNTLSRHDTTLKWAGGLGARYDFGRVEIGANGYIGAGQGNKHNGPPAGFVDALVVSNTASNSTSLNAVTNYGGTAYVQVKLTDTIRATASYSFTAQELASEVGAATNAASKTAIAGHNQQIWYAHGNILWNPVPQVTFGT